jgi:hypothetical protein
MELTQEVLREILEYDPSTGIFTHRTKITNGKDAGEVAGYTEVDGYTRISVRGRLYAAHRLAWLYMYGEFPTGDLDHINRIKGDNRISNLRPCSKKENQENKVAAQKNNRSCGLRGVSWYRQHSKWKAQIQTQGKSIHLGYFDCPHEAHAAYMKAKAVYHPGFVETP